MLGQAVKTEIGDITQDADDLSIVAAGLRLPWSSNGLVGADILGPHVEALMAIDRVNARNGDQSHTTERFRQELLYLLLDNCSRGSIIEVGTMSGGMTALFAYVAAITGRHCFAIDINHNCILATQRTCDRFGLAEYVRLCDGTLAMFVESHGPEVERPDLIFLDSDHSYGVTLAELRLIHSRPNLVPRWLALHDFNYRHGTQAAWFGDINANNPIAVDRAAIDFLTREWSGPFPTMKRCGAFSGQFGTATPDNPGALMQDYIARHGSEGMILVYP